MVPRKDDVGLLVRFRNDSPSALSSIVWRAKYGKSYVDFVYDGTLNAISKSITSYWPNKARHILIGVRWRLTPRCWQRMPYRLLPRS